MNHRTFRATWLGLLASTALATPAFAQGTQGPSNPPQTPQGPIGSGDPIPTGAIATSAPGQAANQSDEIIIMGSPGTELEFAL